MSLVPVFGTGHEHLTAKGACGACRCGIGNCNAIGIGIRNAGFKPAIASREIFSGNADRNVVDTDTIVSAILLRRTVTDCESNVVRVNIFVNKTYGFDAVTGRRIDPACKDGHTAAAFIEARTEVPCRAGCIGIKDEASTFAMNPDVIALIILSEAHQFTIFGVADADPIPAFVWSNELHHCCVNGGYSLF